MMLQLRSPDLLFDNLAGDPRFVALERRIGL